MVLDNLPDGGIALIDRSCLNVLTEISTKSILKISQNKKIIIKKYFETSGKGKYIESFSNFALIELPEDLNSQTLVNALAGKNILIMGGDK